MGGYAVDGQRLVRITLALMLCGWAVAAGVFVLGRANAVWAAVPFITVVITGLGFAVALVLLHRATWTALLSLAGTAAMLAGAANGGTAPLISGAAIWSALAAAACRRGYYRRRRGIQAPWWDSLV
ncbi:hypothetical protein [Streptomyces sp. 2P-4]|uniref:hypothetical protein n=1 Tax=Streptomyces sp. 2P-4 TaxID=2931974 RepID=UPI002540A6C3|nr:hypothetical protein [Streptomyces sp. 2P-4]